MNGYSHGGECRQRADLPSPDFSLMPPTTRAAPSRARELGVNRLARAPSFAKSQFSDMTNPHGDQRMCECGAGGWVYWARADGRAGCSARRGFLGSIMDEQQPTVRYPHCILLGRLSALCAAGWRWPGDLGKRAETPVGPASDATLGRAAERPQEPRVRTIVHT